MNTVDFKLEDVEHLNSLQPEGWDDIIPMFTFYSNSSYCFPVKVMIENDIAGVGTSIIHNDTAWLAHIIVHPSFRKQGIGQFITQSLVNSLQSTDCATIYLIATELGAPVYSKIGFEMETEYLFFKDLKKDKDYLQPSEITFYNEEIITKITQIDYQVSGENRFFHLKEHLQSSYVYIKNNRVEGYYMPSLGEGLIVANTSKAGLELTKLRLTKNDMVAFPVENIVALEFMKQHHHDPNSTAKRMRLGAKRPVMFDCIYSRIGGNLG